MNGTMRRHGKAVGYVVYVHGVGVGTLCHGWNDPNRQLLLGGEPATLFDTLRKAKRAVRDSFVERPEARFSIVRVARHEGER